MMQNLPFLIMQNTSTQQAPLKATAQKPSESGVSFKDVLIKQAVSDVPKAPAKVHTAKQVQGQSQSQQAAKSPENEDGSHLVDDASLGATASLIAVGVKPEKADTDTEDNNITATPQDANGNEKPPIPIMGVPVVTMPVNTQSAQSLDVPLGAQDAQHRLQLDMNSKSASAGDVDAKNRHIKTTDEYSFETETQGMADNKWLESVLSKVRHQAEGGAQAFSDIHGSNKLGADKLSVETGAQLMSEISTKIKSEPVAAIAPSGALQAIARMDSTQIQEASSNVIQPSPGRAGWDQAISQKVVWMVGAEEQSATLTLNPPDLGPLQVVISVNNDKADTTFISENPEVRKVLESGISTLRDLMDQAGVQLGQANVSTSQQQQDYQQAAKERSLQTSSSNNTAKTAETQVVTRTILQINNGLVDTFA